MARTSNTNNSSSPEPKVSRQQTPCRNQSSRNTKASDTICTSNFQNIRVTKHQMSKFKYTDRTQRDYLTPEKPSQSSPPLTKQSLNTQSISHLSPGKGQDTHFVNCIILLEPVRSGICKSPFESEWLKMTSLLSAGVIFELNRQITIIMSPITIDVLALTAFIKRKPDNPEGGICFRLTIWGVPQTLSKVVYRWPSRWGIVHNKPIFLSTVDSVICCQIL